MIWGQKYYFALFEYCPMHLNELPILPTFYIILGKREKNRSRPRKLNRNSATNRKCKYTISGIGKLHLPPIRDVGGSCA